MSVSTCTSFGDLVRALPMAVSKQLQESNSSKTPSDTHFGQFPLAFRRRLRAFGRAKAFKHGARGMLWLATTVNEE